MLGIGVLVAVRFPHEGIVATLGSLAFGLAFALPAFWYGARLRKAQLRITDESVMVLNPIRAMTASLDEAAEFVPGNVTPNAKNGTPGIVLRLTTGRELPVWALAEELTIFAPNARRLRLLHLRTISTRLWRALVPLLSRQRLRQDSRAGRNEFRSATNVCS